MEYIYENKTNRSLPQLEQIITNSDISDKNIDYSRWDELVEENNIGTLTIVFINTLSESDKTKLDILIETQE